MPSLSTARRTLALASAALLIGLPAAAQGAQPADAFFDQQWALQAGQPLDVAHAWDISDGTGSVVAIVDSGVDLTHPDLRGALWTNPGEKPGNGIDDDHDGFIDDVHGADFVGHDGDPTDEDGHGTHIAGIIAAQRNDLGTVGIAPGAKLMVVRVLDAANSGTTADVASGVRYALAHGATVINMSVNGDTPDDDLRAAIAQARSAGVPVVVSSGNNGRNLSLVPSYPASFNDPDLISVAAAGVTGLLASFSNFGSHVPLAAPGVDILSTARGGGYELRSGTSMAAPEVAAVLALMHSARPDMAPSQLMAALTATARRLPGLAGLLGAGEVDAVAALRSIVPASRWEKPVLTPRVRKRAKNRASTLITWSLAGNSAVVRAFRITGPHGVTLARKSAASRGIWVRIRRGAVRITALGAAGEAVAAAVVRLR